MSDTDPGKVDAGEQPADAARPDVERAVADLRQSVQQHRSKAEAARARAEAVATELVATRAGRQKVYGDEQFQERIAQLARDIDTIADDLVADAGDEARNRRAAADLEAQRILDAARDEADSLLGQARNAADQVLTDGGAQISSFDADREQLQQERETVLGALRSLHQRLGDVGSTIGEQP